MAPVTSGHVALRVESLTRHFPVSDRKFLAPKQYVHAVDGIDLEVASGTTLGIVGESGCGKSSLGRLIVGLDRPDSGTVEWGHGADSSESTGLVQAVFQDPASALDPRMSIGAIIGEALPKLRSEALRARVAELLELVDLSIGLIDRLPHELSGGQQQRVCIARAVASDPALILLDEAVSSLDASLQGQVLRLLIALQQRTGAAFVFISHDLRAVRAISDTIAVMYLGQIVELAPAASFSADLLHPYSVALRSAEPSLPSDADRVERIILAGDPPSPIEPPRGCRFASRCPVAQDRCRDEAPEMQSALEGHQVRCHFPGSLLLTPRVESELEIAE